MSKKIIAVSLALFLIVTCFVACGKKYETTKINGEEVILVTDKNGDPVINKNNELIALVTDKAGEVLTYANGEDQTRYIVLQNALEIKGVAYGEHYKMNVLDGWTISTGDTINKDGTDGKSFIKFIEIKDIEKGETLKTYLETVDENNRPLIEGFEKEGFNLTIESGVNSIGKNGISCETRLYKIVDSNNKVIHYAENYYFINNKTIYCINYACIDGIGYDDTFDLDLYLKTNFTFVD